MHLVRIGKRVLNLDNLSYCEAQVWQEEISLKVSFIGSANNTPLTLTDEEAKALWKYLEHADVEKVA